MKSLPAVILALLATSAMSQNGVWPIGSGPISRIPFPLVSAGDVVTLHLVGLPIDMELLNFSAKTTPWPTRVGQFELRVRSGDRSPVPVPIKRVLQDLPCQLGPDCVVTYVTVHLPYDLPYSGSLFLDGVPSEFSIFYGGKESTKFRLEVAFSSQHLAYPCDTGCRPSISLGDRSIWERNMRIKPGDILTVQGYGFGSVEPFVEPYIATGQPSPPGFRARFRPSARYAWLLPDLRTVAPPAELEADAAVLVPGGVGLYQFSIRVPDVPPEARACQGEGSTNLTLYLGIGTPVSICVTPE